MTPLHDWLAERERLAGEAKDAQSAYSAPETKFTADARESQPRLVAMVRALVEAMENAQWDLTPTGRDMLCGFGLRSALRRVSAIAAGEQSAQREER